MSDTSRTSKELSSDGARVSFVKEALGGDRVLTIDDRFPDSWVHLSLAEAESLRDFLNEALPADEPAAPASNSLLAAARTAVAYLQGDTPMVTSAIQRLLEALPEGAADETSAPLEDADGPGEEDGPWAEGWEQRRAPDDFTLDYGAFGGEPDEYAK